MDHSEPMFNDRRDLYAILKEKSLLGVAAEIGVAEGLFSRILADWGFHTIYLVDTWTHSPGAIQMLGWPQSQHDDHFQSVLKMTTERPIYTILRGHSREVVSQVPDGQLDFAFLDATHVHNEVLADLISWWPKIKQGGIIAGHDYLCPDFTVESAVREFCRSHHREANCVGQSNIREACFWIVK